MTRRPTAHMCPPPGAGTTPCCDRPVSTLPIGDRLVLQPDRVTCGKEE